MAPRPINATKPILLLGSPGSGKGTQGKILGSIPGFFHLSCGDVFRSLNLHSEIGQIFCEYSSRGELVPDSITIEFWRQNMHARTVLGEYQPHEDILVLDGIPRNVNQAQILERNLDVLKVIHLTCEDKDLMIERLLRRALKDNRADDARKDVIMRRWEVYEQESAPVLDYYPADRLYHVDASHSPSKVLQDILTGVVAVQNEHYSRAVV